MIMKSNQLAALLGYFSHPIRGEKGVDATDDDMQRNCNDARCVAKTLCIHNVAIDLYVPATHDEAISIAYKNNMLTEDQILEIDCEILDKRDFLIAYEPGGLVSRGMEIEIDYALEHCIPVFEFRSVDRPMMQGLTTFLNRLLDKQGIAHE